MIPATRRTAAEALTAEIRPISVPVSTRSQVESRSMRPGSPLSLIHIWVILMIAGVAGLIISVTLLVVRRRGRASAEVYEERRYTEPPA